MNTQVFIKHSRKALNLTQAQLAELTGKKRVNITCYETGRSIPPGDVILKIIQLRFPKLCLSNKQNENKKQDISNLEEVVA